MCVRSRKPTPSSLMAIATMLCLLSCSGDRVAEAPAPPNILLVVWDTVRADHMSLHGHHRPTTPFVEEWARQARVYDDALSTASTTVPSHASIFTGLMPSEHGAGANHLELASKHHTLAELLSEHGYQTYFYSANPHISSTGNFAQGFDIEQHPWHPQLRKAAERIVRAKVEEMDPDGEIARRLREGRVSRWIVNASGALAERSLRGWLANRDPERPWFAFINYMEAHRPLIPSREARLRMMSEDEMQRSYRVDRSWEPMWSYVFGYHDYTADELALTAATYDAALCELDALFRGLITGLEEDGALDDTVIVLTADHGEHLGEHRLLDHQFSLYDGLIRVPLVLSAPGRLEPGRDPRPVSTHDLFPTLLELAGVPVSASPAPGPRSLLDPLPARARLSEMLVPFEGPLRMMRRKAPDFGAAPWRRQLRALTEGGHKLIWASDQRHELYDREHDPDEARNLYVEQPARSAALERTLAEMVDRLATSRVPGEQMRLSREERDRLEALGYLDPERDPGLGGEGR